MFLHSVDLQLGSQFLLASAAKLILQNIRHISRRSESTICGYALLLLDVDISYKTFKNQLQVTSSFSNKPWTYEIWRGQTSRANLLPSRSRFGLVLLHELLRRIERFEVPADVMVDPLDVPHPQGSLYHLRLLSSVVTKS